MKLNQHCTSRNRAWHEDHLVEMVKEVMEVRMAYLLFGYPEWDRLSISLDSQARDYAKAHHLSYPPAQFVKKKIR